MGNSVVLSSIDLGHGCVRHIHQRAVSRGIGQRWAMRYMHAGCPKIDVLVMTNQSLGGLAND